MSEAKTALEAIALSVAILATSAMLSLPTYAQTPTDRPATIDNNLKPKFIDQQPTDRLSSKLIGASIVDKGNSTIGTLADIVLDDKNVAHAFVVSVGGLLGIGAKYVAVDPSVLMITQAGDKLTLMIDTDKDQLRAAPEYRYATEKKTDAH